jgi:hypothetical protein
MIPYRDIKYFIVCLAFIAILVSIYILFQLVFNKQLTETFISNTDDPIDGYLPSEMLFTDKLKTTLNVYRNVQSDALTWFHDPYNSFTNDKALYADTIAFENWPLNAFMCYKFAGKTLEELESPSEFIKGSINIPVNSYMLSTSQNTIDEAVKTIKEDILKMQTILKNSSPSSVAGGGAGGGGDEEKTKIMGPIYVSLMQYPNKFNEDTGHYIYNQFNISTNKAKPHVRVKNANYTYGSGIVKTELLIMYPMYSNATKMPIQGEPEYSYDGVSYIGIINMIKFFGKYASKRQLCFIECNNSPNYYCGCGTNADGPDIPNSEHNEYKSFCKDPSSPSLFTNYGMIYAVNNDYPVFSQIIQKPKIKTKIEQMITKAVNAKK